MTSRYLLVGLVLAGCSGDDDGNDEPSAAEQACARLCDEFTRCDLADEGCELGCSIDVEDAGDDCVEAADGVATCIEDASCGTLDEECFPEWDAFEDACGFGYGPPDEMFVCDDGDEILATDMCDDVEQCDDGSDEDTDMCTTCAHAQLFACDTPGSGPSCVPAEYECDNFDDCEDGSDEEFCL